jgi:hypothetical protein
MLAQKTDQPLETNLGVNTADPLHARFLHHGSFGTYAAALEQLRDWATCSGYPLCALAAWITVGEKIRVQLATRLYWKPLTPRGQAREALCQAVPASDLLCLEFRRGHVETHELDALVGLHGATVHPTPSSFPGAA